MAIPIVGSSLSGSGTPGILPIWSTGTVLADSKIQDGIATGILTVAKAGVTARTATFPDAAVLVTGSAAGLTTSRMPKGTATAGVVQDSQIADTVTGNVLTIAATLTAPRTITLPDAAVTIPSGTILTGTLANANRLDSTSSAGVVKESFIADGILTSVLTIAGTLTAPRTATIPDKSGTLAMTSDLTGGFNWNRTLQEFSSPAALIGGYTWTARTMPSSSSWNSVAYGNGIYVAISSTSGTIAASSPDAITWTARTLPSSNVWRSVAYGNGTFVAIADSTASAATSIDGITWTAQTLPSSSGWICVAYGNGLFVAVANGPSTIAATSTDGITWTARTLPSSLNWKSVVYGNGIFVAVSTTLGTVAATSVDGVTWTARTLPSSQIWQAVAYGYGVFVAVAASTSTAATSADGVTWTARSLPSSSAWGSIAYGNGIFVTLSFGSASAATSPDGISWTARTSTAASNCVGYGNGTFFTVIPGTANAATSGGALTFAGDFTASRTHTVQDIAGTVPLIEVQPCASFQNKLINPRFDIWQRGTTFTPTLGTETYDADRFFTKIDGTSLVFTVSQQTHTLGALADEPTYFRRCAVTTAGTTSTVTKILAQRIEGVRTFAGKRVIIAFKAKADAARTITPNYVQSFGTGGAPSANVTGAGSGIALTTSWSTYTQIITLPAISGKTMGTTIGTDYLELWLSAAANTVQTIDISDIEVKEVAASGQVNSPFEIRPSAVEMALCQRYLPSIPASNTVTHYVGNGLGASTTQCVVIIPFSVPPRIPPTGLTSTSAAGFGANDSASNIAATSLAWVAAGYNGATITVNVASGLTQFRPYILQLSSTSSVQFTGCEL